MPPKKDTKSEKGQQKSLEKQKMKIAEDKTFGLKNKNKSKHVQKYIKSVQQAAKGQHNVSERTLLEKEFQKKEEKKKQLQQEALLASLFKGTQNVAKVSVTEGRKMDPQTIKAEQQIDVYVDQREQKKTDTMDSWDQAKLEEVIRTKHGAAQARSTDIVCKYFLDALEKRQYGWFWTCPNGGNNCKYRHCLPPGYVLRKDAPKEDVDDEDAEPIEEVIERERAALTGTGPKVTLETFKLWKEKKEKDRRDAVEQARQAEAKRSGPSGSLAVLSGRDLFTYDPSLFVDDAAAAGEDDYQEDEEYWQSVLNDNQKTVDAANAAALATASSADSDGQPANADTLCESELPETGESSVPPPVSSTADSVTVAKPSLFLDADVPDLEELDD